LKVTQVFDLTVEGKLPFGEGASINRPPLFSGVNYQFWKIHMKFFVESLDKGICDAIVNGPFVPKQIIDGAAVDKPWSEWSVAESSSDGGAPRCLSFLRKLQWKLSMMKP